MRSVMFTFLTAGTSVSLLLVSRLTGGEDGAEDVSLLPTWSRKLTEQSAGGGASCHFTSSQP